MEYTLKAIPGSYYYTSYILPESIAKLHQFDSPSKFSLCVWMESFYDINVLALGSEVDNNIWQDASSQFSNLKNAICLRENIEPICQSDLDSGDKISHEFIRDQGYIQSKLSPEINSLFDRDKQERLRIISYSYN